MKKIKTKKDKEQEVRDIRKRLIEAIKKDLIKKKPCPNEHPILSACYEQVIEELNKILNKAIKDEN